MITKLCFYVIPQLFLGKIYGIKSGHARLSYKTYQQRRAFD